MAVEHLLCDLHGHIGLSGRDMGDLQPQRLTGRIMAPKAADDFSAICCAVRGILGS